MVETLPARWRSALGRLLDRDTRELAQLGGVALGLRLLGAVVSLGFTVTLARLLGAAGTGIYYLALSTVSLAAVGGRLGLDNALVRLIAAGTAGGDWGRARGAYRLGMGAALAASAAAGALLAILSPMLARGVFGKPELEGPLRWMAIAVVPLALLTLHGEALKGLKRIAAATSVQSLLVPLAALTGVILLVPRWGVTGAVWAYVLATLGTCSLARYFWVRSFRVPKEASGAVGLAELAAVAMPLFAIALVQTAMQLTATVVLGIYGTSAAVGAFGVASRTAQLATLFLVAVNSIAAPKLAALYGRGDHRALANTARSAAAITVLGASPLLLFFLLAPSLAMRLFGAEFTAGGAALAILSIGHAVNAATGPVGVLLMMSGHERTLLRCVAAAAAVQVIASIALVPPYGIVGAAVAGAAGLASLNLLALVAARRRLGVTVLPALSLGGGVGGAR